MEHLKYTYAKSNQQEIPNFCTEKSRCHLMMVPEEYITTLKFASLKYVLYVSHVTCTVYNKTNKWFKYHNNKTLLILNFDYVS